MGFQKKTFWAALGPGILMAGAAVGVSHLIQATRAGAEYGLALLGIVILACVLKYPFIEAGPRYAAATGESLLRGYRRLGRWALGIFTLITLGTMLIIQAGVTIVTAGLAGFVFGLEASITLLSFAVLLCCAAVLALGRYRLLDFAMKIIMAVLAVSTLAAVILAFWSHPDWTALNPFTGWGAVWTAGGFAFLLALLGWMPIPLDVAAWHSLWTLERAKQTGQMPSVAYALLDFRIGYIGATVVAALFLLLGALIMFGSGAALPESAVAFSAMLVNLYTESLGEWARPVIAVAALTTMFSTTLAVTDAYPRALRALLEIYAEGEEKTDAAPHHRLLYSAAVLLVCGGALAVIHFFGKSFTGLIDFATTVSFLAAPVIAFLNLKLITGAYMPEEHRPARALRMLSYAGFAFLVIFCLIWLGWKIF